MTSTPEVFDKSCPNRILDRTVRGFVLGAIWGSGLHFTKSFIRSSRDQCFRNGLAAARRNGPRTGGILAVWFGLFSACDCTMVYIRQKEDPWNKIVSGAVSAGLLAAHLGPRHMVLGTAATWGGIFAFVEGTGILFRRPVREKQLLQANNDNGAPLAKFEADEGEK